MLAISEDIVARFAERQTDELAARLLHSFPPLGSHQMARRYIDEALSIGLETERDIAEFIFLLLPVDQLGRPDHIRQLLADPDVDGPLKLFQIGYALLGERP